MGERLAVDPALAVLVDPDAKGRAETALVRYVPVRGMLLVVMPTFAGENGFGGEAEEEAEGEKFCELHCVEELM